MQEISEYVPTIDSREVAEMVGKEHKNLIRAIKRYIEYIKTGNELKLSRLVFQKQVTSSKLSRLIFLKKVHILTIKENNDLAIR